MSEQFGTALKLNRVRQRGNIQAIDGTKHEFRREVMVRYVDYLDLQVGDLVRYDMCETTDSITDVEGG